MVTLANRSMEALQALASTAAAELAEMPWKQLASRLDEVRSAARPANDGRALAL